MIFGAVSFRSVDRIRATLFFRAMTDKNDYDWNTGNQFCMNLTQNILMTPLHARGDLVKTFAIEWLAQNEIPLVVVFPHANDMETLIYNPPKSRVHA